MSKKRYLQQSKTIKKLRETLKKQQSENSRISLENRGLEIRLEATEQTVKTLCDERDGDCLPNEIKRLNHELSRYAKQLNHCRETKAFEVARLTELNNTLSQRLAEIDAATRHIYIRG